MRNGGRTLIIAALLSSAAMAEDVAPRLLQGEWYSAYHDRGSPIAKTNAVRIEPTGAMSSASGSFMCKPVKWTAFLQYTSAEHPGSWSAEEDCTFGSGGTTTRRWTSIKVEVQKGDLWLSIDSQENMPGGVFQEKPPLNPAFMLLHRCK